MNEDMRLEAEAVQNEQPKQKKTKEERYIDATAKATAREVVNLQRQQRDINLYRAMERLLRAYPDRLLMLEHPDDFEFFPVGRSKDISIAPPPGTGVVDKIVTAELFVEARKRAFENEMMLLIQTADVMKPYQNKPEFIVVRMYYFNEDANGNSRGDAKPYTFTEIAEALEAVGIQRSEKMLRKWRTKLVQNMTVLMFGADGAVSVEAREPKQGQKETTTEGAKADE